MGNFYTDVLQQHARFRDTAPVGDLALLEPETRRRVEALIADAAAQGVPLMAFETYRSRERQQLLFQQKVTKLQTVGVHHYGLACDIVRSVGGHPSWKGDFSIVGRLARKHGLVWGGDWGRPGVTPSFVDPVHVQRCTVGRQRTLFAGTWYPDDAYDPWTELAAAAPRALRQRGVRRGTASKRPKRGSVGRARARASSGESKPAAKGARGAAAKRGTAKRATTKRSTTTRSATKRRATRPKVAKGATRKRGTSKSPAVKRGGVKRATAKRATTKRTTAKRAAGARRPAKRASPRRQRRR